MSKGLEALQRIIETFYDKESEDIKCVEKELKDYEKLLKDIFPHPKENGEEYRQLAVKRLLALEIIKTKKVDVRLALWSGFDCSLEDYNEIKLDKCELTKEEWNLLKEVLNNA